LFDLLLQLFQPVFGLFGFPDIVFIVHSASLPQFARTHHIKKARLRSKPHLLRSRAVRLSSKTTPYPVHFRPIGKKNFDIDDFQNTGWIGNTGSAES
jgi:hypothetical protein